MRESVLQSLRHEMAHDLLAAIYAPQSQREIQYNDATGQFRLAIFNPR